jgi:hypothetical protein
LARDIFWFESSYFVPQWLGEMKTWKVFDIVGSLHVGITLFSIFIYVYVKQSVEEFLPSAGSVEVLPLELVAERRRRGSCTRASICRTLRGYFLET